MKSKQNIQQILKEVLDRVSPPTGDIFKINNSLNEFKKKVSKKIKSGKIKAEIFVGGSYAKKTLIKKDHYDIDIFMRFSEKEESISEKTEKLLEDFSCERIHGSRDYFRIKTGEGVFLEVVPVKKATKPENAENITDLSYFHVKYVNGKIKSKKILEDIMIAKAFCYANGTYGAESYIQGFSGYALELLVLYYKGFVNFLKAVSKAGERQKIIIDIEKLYKNRGQAMLDINSSKLHSPIILIDPTYKQRNALAALSSETYGKFRKATKEFLKKPSITAFERKKTDLSKIKMNAQKKKQGFILLEAETNRQEGDIAGSKLLKFYRHLSQEIFRFFYVKNAGFNYNKDKTARYYFVVESKEKIILSGPRLDDKKNLIRFRKKHKNVFTNKKRVYAREEVKFSIKQFIEVWKKKNSEKMSGMGINALKIIS